MFAAIAIVAILTVLAVKPVIQKNGFRRKFLYSNLTFINARRREKEIVAIAGTTKGHIYFQTASPDKLYCTDSNLNDAKFIALNVPENEVIKSRFDCAVDSPLVYLFPGNWPGVFKTDLNSGNIVGYRFPTAIYTRSALLSSTSITVRGFDTTIKTPDQIFIKGNFVTGNLVREKNISNRSGDIGISTDGLLHYDSSIHLLVYVFFYKNGFLTLDTSLNLLYTAHTIDTFQTVQTEAGSIQSAKEVVYTTTAPSRFINMENCVSEELLFNYSLLKADNETERNFEENGTIDVYRLRDGFYIGSFYLPLYKKEKIERFCVFGDKIIVLYKANICIYSFKLNAE